MKTAIFLISAFCVLLAPVSAGAALLFGIALALTLGNPFLDTVKKRTPLLLQFSVAGLGAGMNLHLIGNIGANAAGALTIVVFTALTLSLLLTRWIGAERETGFLIGGGTAICGGSAIAALSPAIGARPSQIGAALSTVFLLNALALWLFPGLGRLLDLNQDQFGLWSALAVHDVSSAIGAASHYGPRALEVATTVKLARTLWIVPLVLIAGALGRRSSAPMQKKNKPWFILAFLIASALVTFFPSLADAGQVIASAARKTLVLTLFLIGSSLTRSFLREAGGKPLILGLLLWLLMSVMTLFAVLNGWIYI